MTTLGINLLPSRYEERLAERRRVGATAAALLVLVLALAALSLAQAGRLERAAFERDAEQARTAELSARRSELAPFGQLADGVSQREGVLRAVMGAEVSWARVLADLSGAFPADASLVSFTAESMPAASAGEQPVPAGGVAPIGSTSFSGYSVAGFDPGLAHTLRGLATAPSLSEPTLQEGAAADIGGRVVTTFDGTAFLDTTALSRRYVEAPE